VGVVVGRIEEAAEGDPVLKSVVAEDFGAGNGAAVEAAIVDDKADNFGGITKAARVGPFAIAPDGDAAVAPRADIELALIDAHRVNLIAVFRGIVGIAEADPLVSFEDEDFALGIGAVELAIVNG